MASRPHALGKKLACGSIVEAFAMYSLDAFILAVDQVLSKVSTSLSIPVLTLLPTMHDIGKLRINYFFCVSANGMWMGPVLSS
jgi:hypothetical protein